MRWPKINDRIGLHVELEVDYVVDGMRASLIQDGCIVITEVHAPSLDVESALDLLEAELEEQR